MNNFHEVGLGFLLPSLLWFLYFFIFLILILALQFNLFFIFLKISKVFNLLYMIPNFFIAASNSSDDTQSGYSSTFVFFSLFQSWYWYWYFFLFEIPKVSNLLHMIPNLSMTAFNLRIISNPVKAFGHTGKIECPFLVLLN